MKKVMLPVLLMLVLGIPGVFAQGADIGVVTFDINFFAALVGGIILAVGFQLILTNLATAGGMSLLHKPLKDMKENLEDHGTVSSGDHEKKDKKKGLHSTVRTVNRSFGIFAVIATSIALFFSSWLAVRLSGTLSTMVGVTIGLCVWGLLYVVNMALEMKAVSSMTGSLMHLASSGLKGIADTAGGIFGKSETKKASDTATEIVSAVRDEVFHDVNLRKEINKYIDALKPNYAEMSKQFEKVLADARVETTTRYETPEEETSTSKVHVGAPSMKETGATAKAAASKVQEVKSKVQQEIKSDKDPASKTADAAMEVAGLSREQAEEYRTRVEDYLRNTGKDELNPEGIKHDIEQLFQDPKGGFEAIKERLSNFDISTVSSLIKGRNDMNPEEANKVVNWVTGTLDAIKQKYSSTVDSAGERGKEAGSGIEAKISGYLDSLGQPQLQYQDIKGDFELLLHDPKAGSEALIQRMKSLDRETLKSILASRKDISEEDAEHMISRIEEARDSIVERAEKMKHQVEEKVREAEEEALKQADEVRKTAASAAWWVFTAAIVSGASAAVGGWLGTII